MAIANLDRAIALAPGNADYFYERAQARIASGQTDPAQADLQQALKLRPEDVDARYALAQLRFANGDIEGGAADLHALDTMYPSTADERLGMAELFVSTRPDDALAQYNLWITAHLDDSRRWEALAGRCWARALLNRDLDKAMADCETSRRIRPSNTAMMDSEGLIHLRRGEFARAIVDYNASLAGMPDRAWSLYGRGVAKITMGDAVGGKADIGAAKAVRPTIAVEVERFGVQPRGITPPPSS